MRVNIIKSILFLILFNPALFIYSFEPEYIAVHSLVSTGNRTYSLPNTTMAIECPAGDYYSYTLAENAVLIKPTVISNEFTHNGYSSSLAEYLTADSILLFDLKSAKNKLKIRKDEICTYSVPFFLAESVSSTLHRQRRIDWNAKIAPLFIFCLAAAIVHAQKEKKNNGAVRVIDTAVVGVESDVKQLYCQQQWQSHTQLTKDLSVQNVPYHIKNLVFKVNLLDSEGVRWAYNTTLATWPKERQQVDYNSDSKKIPYLLCPQEYENEAKKIEYKISTNESLTTQQKINYLFYALYDSTVMQYYNHPQQYPEYAKRLLRFGLILQMIANKKMITEEENVFFKQDELIRGTIFTPEKIELHVTCSNTERVKVEENYVDVVHPDTNDFIAKKWWLPRMWDDLKAFEIRINSLFDWIKKGWAYLAYLKRKLV